MTSGVMTLVMMAVAAFFMVFPQLKPDWIQFDGGGRYGGLRRGFPTRQSSWTPSKPVRNAPALSKAEAAFDKGIWHLDRKEWQEAIKQFDEVLRLEPKNTEAFFNRGIAKHSSEKLTEALADFDAVLRLKPQDVDALLSRAAVRIDQQQPRMAIVDLDAALGHDPDNVDAYCTRGKIREDEGEYRLALYDYENAIRRESVNATALNCLAWLLATAPDDAIRDGKRAVEAALRAVELEDAKEWDSIDTLAAAFAETGKFAQAIRSQREALRLAPEEEHEELKSRLELYQAKKTYRLPAKPN
jgi:tetratricopeptide (TPR) repeat protein